MDNSDVEWKLFRIAFPLILATFCLNSSFFKYIYFYKLIYIFLVLLNIVKRIKLINKQITTFFILIPFWIVLHINWTRQL